MSFDVKCFWVLPYHCFLPVCRTATLLSISVLKKKLRPKSRSSKQTVLPFPALFYIAIFPTLEKRPLVTERTTYSSTYCLSPRPPETRNRRRRKRRWRSQRKQRDTMPGRKGQNFDFLVKVVGQRSWAKKPFLDCVFCEISLAKGGVQIKALFKGRVGCYVEEEIRQSDLHSRGSANLVHCLTS